MKKGILVALIFLSLMNMNCIAQLTMTHGDVYNYNTGDVFLVRSYAVNSSGSGYPPDTTYQKTTILNKHFSSSSDTVFYNCFEQKRIVYWDVPLSHFVSIYNAFADSLYYTDLLSPIQNYPFMPSYPCYTDSIDSIYISSPAPILYCAKKIWHKQYTAGPTCFEEPFQNYDYVEGCGGPYYVYFDGTADFVYRTLIYYKKGTDSCGFNIPVTVGVSELSNINSEITLFPNPTSTTFTISATDKIESVKVYNIIGEQLITDIPNNNQSTINISQFSKGIYFAEIKTEKGVVRKKLVKE